MAYNRPEASISRILNLHLVGRDAFEYREIDPSSLDRRLNRDTADLRRPPVVFGTALPGDQFAAHPRSEPLAVAGVAEADPSSDGNLGGYVAAVSMQSVDRAVQRPGSENFTFDELEGHRGVRRVHRPANLARLEVDGTDVAVLSVVDVGRAVGEQVVLGEASRRVDLRVDGNVAFQRCSVGVVRGVPGVEPLHRPPVSVRGGHWLNVHLARCETATGENGSGPEHRSTSDGRRSRLR